MSRLVDLIGDTLPDLIARAGPGEPA